jgi:hypothetical protein
VDHAVKLMQEKHGAELARIDRTDDRTIDRSMMEDYHVTAVAGLKPELQTPEEFAKVDAFFREFKFTEAALPRTLDKKTGEHKFEIVVKNGTPFVVFLYGDDSEAHKALLEARLAAAAKFCVKDYVPNPTHVTVAYGVKKPVAAAAAAASV